MGEDRQRVLVWLDGRVLDGREARVSVEDRGFLLGDGLFETMRARRAVFRLQAHLRRLRSGARRLGLVVPDAVEHAVGEVLEAAQREWPEAAGPAGGRGHPPELAVRLTLTRGPGGPGLEPAYGIEPTLAVSVRPSRTGAEWTSPVPAGAVRAAPPAGATATRGLSLRTSSHRLASRSIVAGIKALGYLPNVLARAEARAAGDDDALLLDDRERVAEACAANLFWVTPDGMLRTPAETCPILPGITRAAVLELARRSGLRVEEGEWGREDLAAAGEAFATSSLRGVAPITALDGESIGGGVVGPRTRELVAAYEELVRTETS